MGTGELVRAAGSVSMDIASALGQAEKVAKLYDLFRGFLGQAYDSLVALLGPHLVKLAGEEAKEWLTKVKEGEPVPSLLERLYETKELHAALKKVIDQTAVDLAQYEIASNELQRLNEQFRRQTSLLDKVLPKLKWGLLIPASALPQGKLVLGLFYIVLTGYAIYLGADYVDASRLQRLGRVPGVCSVIESQLNTGGEA